MHRAKTKRLPVEQVDKVGMRKYEHSGQYEAEKQEHYMEQVYENLFEDIILNL